MGAPGVSPADWEGGHEARPYDSDHYAKLTSMQTLVECVPNFSEGRDPAVVEAIVRALLAGPDVYLLDREMDADHNRCVITIVGSKESIGPAALRGMAEAEELIDLNHHQGAHPRLGATDVVPFVPIAGVTLQDCVHIAEWVAEQAWRQLKIPTYLYEAAARRPERVNLENIRRGQFEGIRDEIATHPERRPDFGEAALHPTAGATVVGAREFLIAYNINLKTADVAPAKTIAKRIRTSSGGFPGVKALGLELKGRNLAQISMNLTDFETTSLATVFDAVKREAAGLGVEVAASEIVGLVPQRALDGVAVETLRIENFQPELVVENRLQQALAGRSSASEEAAAAPLRAMVEGFVAAVAAPTPTPGGGCAAALAGALAAALGEMACGVSLKRKSFSAHYPTLEAARARLAEWKEQLLAAVDRDAESYQRVLRAYKLPQTNEAEQTARAQAIEEASKEAATVPLETAEIASAVAQELAGVVSITIPGAASDLRVATDLVETARRGGIENVRANLPAIHDEAWLSQVRPRLEKVAAPGN